MALKSPLHGIQQHRRRYDDGVLGQIGRIFKFDSTLVTFTPGMAKRATSVFETAPIVQGKWDVSQADLLRFDPGISSPIHKFFYPNLDEYQGAISFWITPEWDGNDGKFHFMVRDTNIKFYVYKTTGSILTFEAGGILGSAGVDISGWTAGTTYHVVVRWDSKNTLDGTNYGCITVNDSHTFVDSTTSTLSALSLVYIGSNNGTQHPANAIIEGLTIYRRPLYDGTYGVAANWDDSGPIDEINAIYNAGSGQDPCLVTGSWDIVFCLPTDSTAGALVTGTGEAWSHPHSSGVLEHQWLEDGGYLGRPWALSFNGSSTEIDCGSGATLDDLGTGGNIFTTEMWVKSSTETTATYTLIGKGTHNTNGWVVLVGTGGVVNFRVYLAGGTLVAQTAGKNILDQKWHHIVCYYNDTTKTARVAVDGIWYDAEVGAGAWQSDAAINLKIGELSTVSAWWWPGLIGWIAISDNDRYSAGTDFIPPRQPYATDGNSVEMWHLDEGTGATANAEVTSPGNDGTISNGTWEEQWDIETTPIVPYSLEFEDETGQEIDCGSAADIDDLPNSPPITFEGWFRDDEITIGAGQERTLFAKTPARWTSGWEIFKGNNGLISFNVFGGTTASATHTVLTHDQKWHHVVGYIHTDDKIRIAVDGIWGSWSASAFVAYGSDAAKDLTLGSGSLGLIDGAFGFFRISDVDRYDGTNGNPFTPPSRLNPPGTDGNTIRQFNFRDGAGITLTDATGTANATINFGTTGQWRLTPDMEIDSPGERIFNWGYHSR
jgi:hypothetical protein